MASFATPPLSLAAAAAAGGLAAYLLLRYQHSPSSSAACAPKVSPHPAVKRVVLTGGPCGGKSSSLEHFSKALSAQGFDIYCAPEIPTVMMNGGCKYPGLDADAPLVEFETALMRLQMQTEDSFAQVAASTGRPSVLVMDRGLLDIKAYLPEDKWNLILASQGLDEAALLARYDMVLHLVSAADGAEKFYTTDNNATRTETPEQARALDKKMIGCWDKHAHHAVVRNDSDFKTKLENATAAVLAVVAPGGGGDDDDAGESKGESSSFPTQRVH